MLTKPRDFREIPRWRSAGAAQWRDWRWQLKHRISTPGELAELVALTPEERSAAERSRTMFRLGITPHYATLIDPDDPDCPIRRQVVPREEELAVAPFEREDPLNEDGDSPVPGVTHRYPDRVLLLLTHECALYCRYCTRRRIVGDHQGNDPQQLGAAIEYIRGHREVRDVLISGGDPLAVADGRLEDVLRRLRAIEHVEIIRIGTRLPVVMPQRITRDLVRMLRRYHPLWLNTHFNHPFELAPVETRRAMERLADAGIPTGNQSVLLRGINDEPAVIKKLMHELVKVRCRPYYLYNCDLSQGLSHFRTSIDRGLEIMESLWGHTSGYVIPTFVVDLPGGGGKIPLLPQYIVSRHEGGMTFRNYRGRISTYRDGQSEKLVAIQARQPLDAALVTPDATPPNDPLNPVMVACAGAATDGGREGVPGFGSSDRAS